MNDEVNQFSYPKGPAARFPSGPDIVDSAAPKNLGDFEPSVHQLPTTRTIDLSITPVPSITPVSSATTPSPLTVPLPMVRQRTAQACDKCRERKTKCSGQRPCARCVARGLLCKYSARESRHRSPYRGIRGTGEPSGGSRSAEGSRYIDSSTKTVPASTSNPTIHSNPSMPMPPYRIRPNNPSLSSTPAFAQRSYLDERVPFQRHNLSQHNTQRRIDSTRLVRESLGPSSQLPDAWQQQGSQETPTRHVGYGNQLGLNLNRNPAETPAPASSSMAMYKNPSLPHPPPRDDPSAQVRASIDGPSRGGHWNFNIELTQYENAGPQPPTLPSVGLQQYIAAPAWPNEPSPRSSQNYESGSSRYSSVETGVADESKGGSEYWGQGISSAGNYERPHFTTANSSNVLGRDEGMGNEFNMEANTNPHHQYQDTFSVRVPQQPQNQSHYSSSGSFSNDLDTPVSDAYSNREMGHSDTRLSSLGRSQHESQGSLELSHPMPVTPIGTHFASALTMPMHNHLAQFQGLERGSPYHREITGYNSTSESHFGHSFDFNPPNTFPSA